MVGGGYFTERSGTEWNQSYRTQFSELYCSEKGSRPLYYVHNVILECKTVHYSYYIENIIINLRAYEKAGNWKRKLETENKWKRNLLAVAFKLLLVFDPWHPSSLPASSFRHCRSQLQCKCAHLGHCLFSQQQSIFAWCSILSKQLILYMS